MTNQNNQQKVSRVKDLNRGGGGGQSGVSMQCEVWSTEIHIEMFVGLGMSRTLALLGYIDVCDVEIALHRC